MKIQEEAVDLAQREELIKATETQLIRIEIRSGISQIEDIVNEFEKQLRNARTDEFNSLLKQSESAVASVVEAYRRTKVFPIGGTPASSYMPQIGEKVNVKGLGYKFATVVEVDEDDGTVLVQCGKMKVRVDISSICLPPPSVKDATRNSAPHMKKTVCQNGAINSYMFLAIFCCIDIDL